MMRILHVVGARPNFMKVAPVMKEMSKYPDNFEQILVHTGQHYDDNMSQVFFDQLELPQPDMNLGVGSGSHACQTAEIMQRFEPIVNSYKPDWVVVVGDVNSTLACALVSAKLGIKVAHVEAGLRSFDRTMPEEVNRLLTDQLADLLFTHSPEADDNLIREGIAREKICFVGNVMIDTLVRLLAKSEDSTAMEELGLRSNSDRESREGSSNKPYVLVTLHRPSNVDKAETLAEILCALDEISNSMTVIFPTHPRTRKRIEEQQLVAAGTRLRLIDPLGYLDFLSLMKHAALIVTDSGGVQEETTFLRIPCLTLRPNTERPITILQGTNRLVASERNALVTAFNEGLNGHRAKAQVPKLWDGHAAERIVKSFY